MNKQYFGTDGIRGRVGAEPITAEFMLRLGWAAGRVFSRKGRGYILIGKDTRVSGYMFESALEAGLVSAGVDVSLLGPMPTPAIAYLTRTFRADAGIVISASHNSYEDNGIKFFSSEGQKLDDEIEAAIEGELSKEMRMVPSDQIGKVTRIEDAAGRYIEFCKSCFKAGTDLKGMKIALDCAHGATYHIAPAVLRELGAEVVEMGTKPDGFNINEDVGSTKPDGLAALLLETGADIGIALDGDGDRLVMIDHKGEIVDGDDLLYIITMARHDAGLLKGGVAGTLMSNFGLEEALHEKGIPFVRAAVGDRYVLAELLSRDWVLGGESSGHLLCLDLTTTGDGIVSALQVLSAMQQLDASLYELKSRMRKYPQCMINVACQNNADPTANDRVAQAIEQTEHQLAGRGRVLLRPSGTEPLVRVMVEGEDEELVLRLTEDLAQVVSHELG